MDVLFPFLSERYEHTSVLIPTNLVLSEWERICKNPMTTMVVSSDDQRQGPLLRSSYIIAAVDRVVHHCVILDLMAVDSYRVQQASAQHASEARSDRQE